MKLAVCCYQAPSQVLRFGGAKYILRRLDFRLYYMFKTNFPGDNTIWGYKNICVGTCTKILVWHFPRMSPVATGVNVTTTDQMFRKNFQL